MIQAIYMAAGNSRRFGSNKLLFPWKGKTMYRHGLDLLLELKKEMKEQLSVIVVTQYPEILEEVQKLPEASVTYQVSVNISSYLHFLLYLIFQSSFYGLIVIIFFAFV